MSSPQPGQNSAFGDLAVLLHYLDRMWPNLSSVIVSQWYSLIVNWMLKHALLLADWGDRTHLISASIKNCVLIRVWPSSLHPHAIGRTKQLSRDSLHKATTIAWLQKCLPTQTGSCVWIPGAQLLALLSEGCETLGDRALLEEMHHQGMASLESCDPVQLLVWALCFLMVPDMEPYHKLHSSLSSMMDWIPTNWEPK